MQQLSQEELELIVGGVITHNNPWSVVVTAAYAGDWGSSWTYHSDYSWQVNDTYWYNDGGSGGSDPGLELCRASDGMSQQAYMDQLASQFSRDIKQLDWYNKEYLQIVYRDPWGTLRVTSRIEGGAGVSVDIQATWGIAATQIVGIMHNHPYKFYGGSEPIERINQHPSANDWATADNMVARGANPNTLDLYVVDTQGKLRVYQYSDQARYNPPTQYTSAGVTISRELQPAPCN